MIFGTRCQHVHRNPAANTPTRVRDLLAIDGAETEAQAADLAVQQSLDAVFA